MTAMELNISHSQRLSQEQTLKMTPRLQQSISMLQKNVQELSDAITTELEENPTIEIDESSENLDDIEKELLNSEREKKEVKEEYDNSDIDWNDYFQQNESYYRKEAISFESKDNETSFENFVGTEQTLEEHLLLQLKINTYNEKDYSIGEFIISRINSSGYLTIDILEIAKSLKNSENIYAETVLTKYFERFNENEKCTIYDIKKIFSEILDERIEDIDHRWKTLSKFYPSGKFYSEFKDHIELDIEKTIKSIKTKNNNDVLIILESRIRNNFEKALETIDGAKILNKVIADAISEDVEDVEALIQLIKTFTPIGVCAFDLKECLMIQYQNLGHEDDIIESIIKDHLNDLAKNKIDKIAKDIGVDIELIKEAHEFIKTLNPRPGLEFVSSQDTHYISPEVFVELVGNKYIVKLNETGIPRLRINNFYKNVIINKKSVPKKLYEYVKEKLNSAAWLINSIEQRRSTILKVSEAIVEFQKDFLDKGIEYIKPLTGKEIAEKIEMHESTVSRVTTNKYMQTPRGLYELKFFFSRGLAKKNIDIFNNSKRSISNIVIQEKIKNLVSNEDKKHPLTDVDIVELLKKDNIKIARRTVTKYRKILDIPSSTLRKEH